MKITSQWLIYTVGQLESNFKDGKELRDPAVCNFWRVLVVYSAYALFLCSYACYNSFQPCKLLQRHEQTRTLSLTDLSYQYYEFQGFIQCFLYISTCLFIFIFHNFCLEFLILFSLSVHVCEYFVCKRWMNQCNEVVVFKCLLFNSTTFYPCSLLSHINALACMSLLCLTEGIKVKWKHRQPPPCMGPSIFHIYPCVEKSEVFFSGPAGRAAMPVHTGLRGASHPCGRFFSAQKVQGCVSSYVRHGIFNPKLMSETVK